MKNSQRVLGTIAIPLLCAVILLVICAIGGKQMIQSRTSFNYFVLYAAIVFITTLALSINLNSGRFDFSLGAMAVLSSVLSAKLSYMIGQGSGMSTLLMLVLCILSGALLGLLSSLVYVLLRIPPIIASLGVTLIFEGITFTITGGKYVMDEVRGAGMTAFAGNWYYPLIVIAVVLAVSVYLFEHTRFGYEYSALKEGQKVAASTGIREVPNAVVCYMICGALMGIVGFLNAARSSNINGGSLNFGSIGIMFTAFLPMFMGSYIGRYSNDKLGYLLAALTMSMLNSTFAAFSGQISASMQSIINAVLLVVFLIYLGNEGLIRKMYMRPSHAK